MDRFIKAIQQGSWAARVVDLCGERHHTAEPITNLHAPTDKCPDYLFSHSRWVWIYEPDRDTVYECSPEHFVCIIIAPCGKPILHEWTKCPAAEHEEKPC